MKERAVEEGSLYVNDFQKALSTSWVRDIIASMSLKLNKSDIWEDGCLIRYIAYQHAVSYKSLLHFSATLDVDKKFLRKAERCYVARSYWLRMSGRFTPPSLLFEDMSRGASFLSFLEALSYTAGVLLTWEAVPLCWREVSLKLHSLFACNVHPDAILLL